MKFKIPLILMIIVLMFSNTITFSDAIFSSKNVYHYTKELSLNKYGGRLAGEKGNILAAKYIEGCFKSIGIKPIFKNNSYYQNFSIYVPHYNGNFCFRVYDSKGKKIKEYMYGEDYKEITYGNVSPGIIYGKLKSNINYEGNIFLINAGEINESITSYAVDKNLKHDGIAALIYETNTSLRFKSPYKLQIKNNNGLVKLMVTKNVFKELCAFSEKSCTFYIKSPLYISQVNVNNVVGVLNGTDKRLPPIILSCHFDHVGFDDDGIIYPGALDNASGTGFLLECARVLQSYSRKRDIIIAAFNAEEEGLLGSEYFARHSPVNIRNADSINFDMIGSSNNLPLSIIYSEASKGYASKLLNLMRSTSIKLNMEYGESSDHASFTHAGISSVTFIHDDESKIHTPNDTITNVSESRFMDVFTVLNSFLATKGITISSRPNMTVHTNYSNYAIIIASLTLLLITACFILRRKK